MEGGWQHPRRHRRRTSEKATTTFFVTRFPEDYSSMQLKSVFQDFGKVTDVFIPEKKTKGGYLFAFVRFVGVTQVAELEGNLNTVVLKGRRISANVARYGRDGNRIGGHDCDSPTVAHTTPAPVILSRNVESGMPVSSDRSFKQVLLERSANSSRMVEVEVFPTRASISWGSNVLIGDAVNLEALENLRMSFDAIGIPEVEFVYRGGLGVLVAFPESISVGDFIVEWKDAWKGWFSYLQLWNGQQVPYQRLAWLSIRGVPIQCWDDFVIDRIGEKFGRVLLNSQLSSRDSNISSAKICVLVSSGEPIVECLDLKWNSSSYPIWVVEENVDWSPVLASKPINSFDMEDEDVDGSVGLEVSDFESLNDAGEDGVDSQETGFDLPETGTSSPEVDAPVEDADQSEAGETSGDNNDDRNLTCMGNMKGDPQNAAHEQLSEPHQVIESHARNLSLIKQSVLGHNLVIGPGPTLGGVHESHNGPPLTTSRPPQMEKPLGVKGVTNVMSHSGRNKGSRKGHPISMKLKDTLWFPKQNSMVYSKSFGRKAPLSEGSKTSNGSNGSVSANYCNSAEEEVNDTIKVGGEVGFIMANQVSKLRNLVAGDGVKSVSK
ncbi:hypothetical protein QVD17_14834 [Tagetes erecta]|uniref:RRM domain-containing protein n=1 Tax=Tagetes erecta TaxID=13708 RepID=A0AAD8NS16_TARER|nr:hypothetical protein QVD17_14834 [Tagetes erecta]